MSRTPLPRVLDPLTVPASRMYALAVALRNRRYDRAGPVGRLAVPVVSVGNITAGGAGKTPTVAWLARRLCEAGRRPLIAMRGYGADRDGFSDEQAVYADLLPDVPVAADPDRLNAVREELMRRDDVDAVLLDDGFQHRQLHRDLDVVLIDASRDLRRERLLPAGMLREPPASLHRAGAVVVTHADRPDDDLAALIERFAGQRPVAWCRHTWIGLDVHDGGASRREPIGWLDGRRIITMLGIASPRTVHRQLEHAGAHLIADVPASDHERYDRAKLSVALGLARSAEALVVTHKDWVKIRRLLDSVASSTPIVVPRLEMHFVDGEAALLQRVRAALVDRHRTIGCAADHET